ncbi:MAG: tetraacyldisaccharide 4'-kinase [Luteimonas sp.]
MSASANRTPPWWYDDRPPPLGAWLLSSLYGSVVAARLALFKRGLLRRSRVGAPVVVIGNLVAGGSGKTPLTIALVERLRADGWTPGVATRGYGRDAASQSLWVERDTEPALGGDEPVLIARRTGARVRADRDRVAAARTLVAAGCDVVVCDDGLQHYRLARDIEIEVIDGRRRYGNGLLLPAGPLREPVTRGQACDFHVVNLPAADAGNGALDGTDGIATAGFGEWPMRLLADRALPVLGGRPQPLSAFAGQRVHAIAGIGDPERFFAMLRALGIAVVPHAFADHHRYVASDFEFGSDLPVLMTEKDVVKCAAFASARHYSVPVRAELPEAFWVALLDRLPRPVERTP